VKIKRKPQGGERAEGQENETQEVAEGKKLLMEGLHVDKNLARGYFREMQSGREGGQ